MSTTDAVVTGNTAALTQTWLQKHERLILVTLFLAVALWLGNKWLVNQAANDNAKVVVATQQLTEQKAQNQQLADQVKQTTLQYQQVLAAITAQNAQLVATIKQRNTELSQQQQTDQKMPLSDLGQRWATLANVQPTDLTPTPTGIIADDVASRSTVETMEQVPVLQQNLKDTQTIADSRQDGLNKCAALMTAETQQIAGLNSQITDQQKVCQAQIASVKATARKGKRNWFLTGLSIGATAAIWIGTHF